MSTTNRQAPSVLPDASMEPLVSADQGPPKLHPALQRLKDRNHASRLSAMKARLSIDDKYCGALTSKELDSTLEGLVWLLHCQFHDHGPPSESRVGIWIEGFPEGANADTSPVVVARKVRKTLGRTSTVCAGFTKAGLYCQSRLGGQKVQNCERIIAQLVKPDDYMNRAVCELFLSVLEANRYCRWHVSQHSMDNVHRWLEGLSLIHEVAQPGYTAFSGNKSSLFVHPGHAALTLARTRSGLQAKVNGMLETGELFSTKYNSNKLPWPSDTLIEFWPPAPDITPLVIISRAGSEMNEEQFNPTIRGITVAPLDPDDQKPGYVYAYEIQGSPGLVKIGYTSRSIEVRHKEWTADCNRETTLLYPVKPAESEFVPNARRVEALCHAELGKYKLRIYCHSCMKQHTEWFDVAAERAIEAIRKWTSWMKVKPHRRDLYGRTVLSSEWKQALVNE
ncbi:hypothetical protein LTR29_017577 [Friedmanniomyces endolithicus]|nr:hypothetical protein LTR29_017577 [Friedmanniomyces endolithicus]